MARPKPSGWARRALLAATLLLGFAAPALAQAPAAPLDDEEINVSLLSALSPSAPVRRFALASFVARGSPDVSAGPLFVMQFGGPGMPDIAEALARLTGQAWGSDWHAWMRWQERSPEIRPHPGFAHFQARMMAAIDPRMLDFLAPPRAHRIRLEEIVWGGVTVDGIPALIRPAFVAAAEAGFLDDGEPVFGIAINGDVWAYPLRIMDWHEMANDVVGGVPVALAYCTLCGAAILFDAAVKGHDQPFEFGSSGLLYRSNKLMYDRATRSLWNQFTGEPVVGPLAESGIRLSIRPVASASWGGRGASAIRRPRCSRSRPATTATISRAAPTAPTSRALI